MSLTKIKWKKYSISVLGSADRIGTVSDKGKVEGWPLAVASCRGGGQIQKYCFGLVVVVVVVCVCSSRDIERDAAAAYHALKQH